MLVENYFPQHTRVAKETPFADVNRMNLLLVKLNVFLGYVVEYCYFTTACLIVSTHNPPDTLFLGSARQTARKEICV